ncbi:LysM peptidoglycan-binding domain-containing protein [Bacteroidota bacterium]
MGLFDFLKSSGDKHEGDPRDAIKTKVEQQLAGKIVPLFVNVDEAGTVYLSGMAVDQATWEKAILLAGNIDGVSRVDSAYLRVRQPEPEPEPQPKFYTIQAGDSLSRIAKAHYGDAMKWNALFEANREVIKDPDLIYPGQQIRIPEL